MKLAGILKQQQELGLVETKRKLMFAKRVHKEAHKEIRLPFETIKDSQKITDVQEKAFKVHGLDMHRDELINEQIIDDHDKQVRILKVRAPKKYFFIGR